MKLQKYIFIVITILFVTALYTFSQDDDYATIDNTVFENPQRTQALFDHDSHNKMAELEDDCSICHHVYEDKKLIEDESSEDSMCSECHSLKKTPENSIPLRMAFHNRCKECHFESNKGPVLCGECHIRK
ncbi:MAG: cytochrome c3 family protein [Desulfobacteraceae bacterium]|nr:cytochrome c3 family protein [Desulfobacteraceae bacterium]